MGRKCRGRKCSDSQVAGVRRVSGTNDPLEILPRLGAAIRRVRVQKGLSQEALADAAQIDRSHMGRIERGERNVTILNLHKIAVALGVPMGRLVDSVEQGDPS